MAVLALLVSVVFLSGCGKELPQGGEQTLQKTFVAAQTESSKTSLNDDFSVDWSKNDIIRYYSSNGGTVREHTVKENSHSTRITAPVGTSDSYFIAVYGAGSLSDNTGNSLTINGAIQSEQNGTFKDAHLSIAKVYLAEGQNDYTLNFSNITSLIKFSLERTDVQYVIFSTSDEAKIQGNGTVKVTYSGTTPSFSFGQGGGSSIRVNTAGAGTFYIATLPCSFAGFTIKCYAVSGECLGVVTYTKQLTLEKDKITNLGTLDSRIKDLPATDLSEKGTANCYIVSEKGRYKFKTTKGSSNTSIGEVKGVKVLWETFGTDTAPTEGELIKAEVAYSDNYITFSTNDSFKKGNALIAAYSDAACTDGNVLWSWHIWLADKPEEQVYSNSAGTMMDRNLGATSATPGDVRALGLMYQWGRKDPFLGSSSISSAKSAESTLTWPAAESSSSYYGTIAFGTAHPTTFIIRNSLNLDWYYTADATTDNTRWQTSDKSKSIYDPCPAGWRVCDAIWAKAFNSTYLYAGPYDSTNKGMNFGSENGKPGKQLGPDDPIWYPYSGYISDDSGILLKTGEIGHYWSCSPSGKYAYYLLFSSTINPETLGNRAAGRALRCMKM